MSLVFPLPLGPVTRITLEAILDALVYYVAVWHASKPCETILAQEHEALQLFDLGGAAALLFSSARFVYAL